MSWTKTMLRRTTVLAVMVLVTLGWYGCSNQQTAQNQSATPSPTDTAKSTQPKPQPEDPQARLNREAQSEFDAQFKKWFTECGDSYFHRYGRSFGDNFIRQYKDCSLSPVLPQPISEIERMNGLEYSGKVTFAVNFERLYDSDRRTLNDWFPGGNKGGRPYIFSVQKTKGRWVTSGNILEGTAIKCSEAPKD